MPSVPRLIRSPTRFALRMATTPVGAAPQAARRLLRPGRDDRGPLREAVEGRVVVVTGASSGIGEATAQRLAGAGARVVLVARREGALGDVAERIAATEGPGEAFPVACDLTDLEAVDALAASLIERFGVVDVLVNNAGRSIRRPIAESLDRFHDYERTMQLNYFAAVRLTLGLLGPMLEQRSGHVVNISTAGTQARAPMFSAYLASKAALDAFGDVLAAEQGAEGIRVTTVHMPLVRTPMIAPTEEYARTPALSPAEAADMVAQAVAFRPRRLGPAYAVGAAIADAAVPELTGYVRAQAFRRGIA